MRKMLLLLCLLVSTMFGYGVGLSAPARTVCDTVVCNYRNNRLPVRPDTLRILGVGNSFTDDGMIYLPDLLREAGVENVVLGRLYYPGCSLEQHCAFYEEGTESYIYYKSRGNVWTTDDEHASLVEALTDERWDVIVLQQASHLSGIYETYEPWLEDLISVIMSYNYNPNMCLAWQMTWAYAADSDHAGFANYDYDQLAMYESIVGAAKRMQNEMGIEVVIPSGAVIHRLRADGVESLRDFTRDGYHLDLGIGRYAVACAWFEALVGPVFGRSVVGNPFRIPVGNLETTPVDNEVASKCQITVDEVLCCRE